MEFVIIHLQLKDNTEKVVNIIWIRIYNDVPDSFFLDLPQYRPKIEYYDYKYEICIFYCSACIISHTSLSYVYTLQHKLPVIFRVSLPNVKIKVLHWWCSYQVLKANQPKFIFIQNCSPGPI